MTVKLEVDNYDGWLGGSADLSLDVLVGTKEESSKNLWDKNYTPLSTKDKVWDFSRTYWGKVRRWEGRVDDTSNFNFEMYIWDIDVASSNDRVGHLNFMTGGENGVTKHSKTFTELGESGKGATGTFDFEVETSGPNYLPLSHIELVRIPSAV